MTDTDETHDVGEDRFDVDLILGRALAADEADLVAHGRARPTLADLAAAAYRVFAIGVWEMGHDRHDEAVPWRSDAADSGIEEARPLLAICLAAAERAPEPPAATVAEPLRDDATTAGQPPGPAADSPSTPIYDAVLAHAHTAAPHSHAPGLAPPRSEHACSHHGAALLLPRHATTCSATTAASELMLLRDLVRDVLSRSATADRVDPDLAYLCRNWITSVAARGSSGNTAPRLPLRLPRSTPQGSFSRTTRTSRARDIDLLALDATDEDPAATVALLQLRRVQEIPRHTDDDPAPPGSLLRVMSDIAADTVRVTVPDHARIAVELTPTETLALPAGNLRDAEHGLLARVRELLEENIR
uniref:hypothetical protein n=1 Tax=Amycolatopsis sp. CA-096443 TaxID=3239919 RepID=UPI003F491559